MSQHQQTKTQEIEESVQHLKQLMVSRAKAYAGYDQAAKLIAKTNDLVETLNAEISNKWRVITGMANRGLHRGDISLNDKIRGTNSAPAAGVEKAMAEAGLFRRGVIDSAVQWGRHDHLVSAEDTGMRILANLTPHVDKVLAQAITNIEAGKV
jgi:hypothetical protein